MPTHVDIDRLLISVGKEAFVTYYDAFADRTLTNEDVAALLPAEYTEKSRRSRTSHARRIIREGLAIRALDIIPESDRLDPDTIRRARELRARVRRG